MIYLVEDGRRVDSAQGLEVRLRQLYSGSFVDPRQRKVTVRDLLDALVRTIKPRSKKTWEDRGADLVVMAISGHPSLVVLKGYSITDTQRMHEAFALPRAYVVVR